MKRHFEIYQLNDKFRIQENIPSGKIGTLYHDFDTMFKMLRYGHLKWWHGCPDDGERITSCQDEKQLFDTFVNANPEYFI